MVGVGVVVSGVVLLIHTKLENNYTRWYFPGTVFRLSDALTKSSVAKWGFLVDWSRRAVLRVAAYLEHPYWDD